MPLVNQNVTSSKSFCLVIVHEVHYARWSFHFLQDHISRTHQIWIQSITLFYDNINLVIHIIRIISSFVYNPMLYPFSFIISFIIWIVLLQIDKKIHLVFKRILMCRWHEEIISCIKWDLFLPLNSNYFCYYLQIDPQTHDLPW